jgi:hypothetical protein
MSSLPTVIDLRKYAGQIYDQESQGSCVPNAAAAAINFIQIEQGLPAFNLSRDQLYYDAQTAAGQVHNATSGTIPAYVMKTMMDKGVATEASYGYSLDNAVTKPPQAVIDEAAQHKITGWVEAPDHGRAATMSFPMIVNWVDNYLREGKPVIIGFTVKSWYPAEHGDLYTINPDNQNGYAGGDFGGHAGLIVGSDPALCGGNGGFIVQNSWGTSVGDHGFMVIPWNEFPGRDINPSSQAYNIISLNVITGFNGIDQTFTVETAQVAEMFAIELRRAPEAAAIKFFADFIKQGTFSVDTIAQAIWNSPEAQALHAGQTNTQIVQDMFHFILGRDADTPGLNFYVAQLDAGKNAGVLYHQVAEYVQTITSGGDMLAHDYLMNEINMGQWYGLTQQADGNHLQVAHNAISLVTSDANQLEIVKVGIHHDLGYI